VRRGDPVIARALVRGLGGWPAAPAILAALVLAAATPAIAATSCSVSAVGGLAFGTIDILSGMAVDVNGGSIQVNCSGADGAVPYTIALDAGSGPGASVPVREMQGASATFAYSIYQSPADRGANSPWGTLGVAALSTSLTISGGAGTNSSPVYGRVFGGQQTAPPGAYSDTVNITVTY